MSFLDHNRLPGIVQYSREAQLRQAVAANRVARFPALPPTMRPIKLLREGFGRRATPVLRGRIVSGALGGRSPRFAPTLRRPTRNEVARSSFGAVTRPAPSITAQSFFEGGLPFFTDHPDMEDVRAALGGLGSTEFADGLTFSSDDTYGDFVRGVFLGVAGQWRPGNVQSQFKTEWAEAKGSPNAAVRGLQSKYKAILNSDIGDMQAAQSFGFWGRGDAKDQQLRAAMQKMESDMQDFIDQKSALENSVARGTASTGGGSGLPSFVNDGPNPGINQAALLDLLKRGAATPPPPPPPSSEKTEKTEASAFGGATPWVLGGVGLLGAIGLTLAFSRRR